MIEDKLNVPERRRLEALSQANTSLGAPMRSVDPDEVLAAADQYERFIRDGYAAATDS